MVRRAGIFKINGKGLKYWRMPQYIVDWLQSNGKVVEDFMIRGLLIKSRVVHLLAIQIGVVSVDTKSGAGR